MIRMAINRVVFGTTVLIDISDSTVTQDMLPAGVIAYDKSGKRLVGQPKKISFNIYDESADSNVLSDTVEAGTTWEEYAQNNDKGVMFDSGDVGFEGTPIYLGREMVKPEDEIFATTYSIN